MVKLDCLRKKKLDRKVIRRFQLSQHSLSAGLALVLVVVPTTYILDEFSLILRNKHIPRGHP